MPKAVVEYAFERRSWAIQTCSPLNVYTVAGQLGVGYETLVRHMTLSLRVISPAHSQELLRSNPKKLRQEILAYDPKVEVTVVDRFWDTVPIDLQVGDIVLLPSDSALEGQNIRPLDTCNLGLLAEAVNPGKGRVTMEGPAKAIFTRVSRRDYVGRSIFRHLEDPDEHQ